jgi:hydrogenase nickel incorporation protein HypA/HybF
VWVAVGELSAVEPDLLRFAWEAVTAGTRDAGSTLEVEWRPARQVCERCGEPSERAAGSWLRLCPRCQGPLRLEGGMELDLVRLAFVTDDPLEEPRP